MALNGLNRGGCLNKQGELKKLFVCFNPKSVNVSKSTYVQTKLQFSEREKTDEATAT